VCFAEFVSEGGLGIYNGTRRSNSMTFGNLYFTREGKVQMIFPDVGDPNAVKRLVQTLAKEFRQANVAPLEEACDSIKKLIKSKCALSGDELELEMRNTAGNLSLYFNLANKEKAECVKSVVQEQLAGMSSLARPLFNRIIDNLNEQQNRV
jgi:hypothetical protein